MNTRVTGIAREGANLQVTTRTTGETFDAIVLAVAPQHLATLTDNAPALAPAVNAIQSFAYRPIYSVYLSYPTAIKLPKPMLGLDARYAQWLFDRGLLCNQPGVLGAVISADGAHQDLHHDELAARVHEEIRTVLPDLPPPAWYQVIAEKQATFASTVGVDRPTIRTNMQGVFLAGDYVRGDYPASLEAAVRGGVGAARQVMEYL